MLKCLISRDTEGHVCLQSQRDLASGEPCLCVDGFQLLGMAGARLSYCSHACDKTPDKALKEEELFWLTL